MRSYSLRPGRSPVGRAGVASTPGEIGGRASGIVLGITPDRIVTTPALAPSETETPSSGAARAEHYAAKLHADRERLRQEVAACWRGLRGDGPAVLELGCGHGHFLVEYARLHSDQRCLGVDFSRDRIRRARRKQASAGLANVGFIRAEVREFLAVVPTGLQVASVLVLFPDPWPKRRHRKKRLVNGALLARLEQIAVPGARFHFRSDALDYVAEVRRLLEGREHWRVLPGAGLPIATRTVFESKAPGFDTVVAEYAG